MSGNFHVIDRTLRSLGCNRAFSSQIFDRKLKARQKLWALQQQDCFLAAGGLRKDMENRLFEKVKDLRVTPQHVAILGYYGGDLRDMLKNDLQCSSVLQADIFELSGRIDARIDEETWIPPTRKFDLIIGNMNLHWINDLEAACSNVRQALQDSGCFLGSIYGNESLYELRSALSVAQQEIEGGVSPRVSPMICIEFPPVCAFFLAVPALASLLLNSGFHDVTLDHDEIRILYPGLREILYDLQVLGESSAIIARKPYLRRSVIKRAEEVYRSLFGDSSGALPVTVDVISFIGWKTRLTEGRSSR